MHVTNPVVPTAPPICKSAATGDDTLNANHPYLFIYDYLLLWTNKNRVKFVSNC